jgi:uncharacterized protein
MENQCLGLSDALSLQPVIKRIHLSKFWREIALNFNCGWRLALGHTDITAPWPDLLLATGRTSVVASLFIKNAAGQKTFAVQLQNPTVSIDRFDRVIAPAHDELCGGNVIQTTGALHRVTAKLLRDEVVKWTPRFAHLRRPWVAVLLGGNNSFYRLGLKEITEIGTKLAALAQSEGVGLLITPSRRTGDANMIRLREILRNSDTVIWDRKGDNPYYGMLGSAQSIIVTCDSINMLSEACSTGKPVHIIQLPGYSRKFMSFQRSLFATNRARPFNGTLQSWRYEPLQETNRVAVLVRSAYEAFRT